MHRSTMMICLRNSCYKYDSRFDGVKEDIWHLGHIFPLIEDSHELLSSPS